MKLILRMLIAAIFLCAFIYVGQAQKANKVKEVMINTIYGKGEISQVEWENLKRQNSLLKTLFSPKEVLNAD